MLLFTILLGGTAIGESLLFVEERSTAFEDVVVSPDEQWVAFGTGSAGQIHLLSVNSWTLETLDVCVGSLGALAFDETGYLYVGCDATGILQIDPSTGSVESEIPVDATGFYFASLYGGNLFVLAENPNGGNPRVHQIDLQQLVEQDSGNFPTTLGYGAPKDMERVGNYLIVAHGATSISKVDPVSGGATRDQQGPTTGACEDVLPEENATNALISGGSAGVYRFLYSSNQLQFASIGADVDLASSLIQHEEDLWVADSTSDSLKAFSYSAGGATMGTDVLVEVPLDVGKVIQEMVSVQGYIVSGTDDGAVLVVGNGPWVEAEIPTPAVLEDETDFTVSFNSTQDGTFEMLLHATTNDDGTVLASGTVNADETTQQALSATEDFFEGENTIRIVVTSEDGVGHDSFELSIDTPPTTPTLTQTEVGFGDEQILISGTAISDSDVSYYQVYLSTSQFQPSDYAEDGPVWDVEDSSALRIDVTSNEVYEWSLGNLTNDQEYFVSIRAFDEGGKFSALSTVQSVTPRDTFSASQLAGEEGGFCGLNTPLDWVVLLCSSLILTLRRREWGK